MEGPNFNPAPAPYQNRPQQYPGQWEDASPLSVGSYIIMFLISMIPVVNIIMLLIWGFGNSNRNRKNWARAQLIILAVAIVLGVIFGASIVSSLGGAGSRY